MGSIHNAVFSVTIILMSIIFKCNAGINCYYCNSANNSACLDLNQYDEETRGRIVPIVDCDTAIPSPVKVNFFCRKIVQTIFHSHRESEVRVTRGCGWVPQEKPCYRADNRDHLETVCRCFENHCNGANVSSAAATGLFLALAAILCFVH